MECEFMQESIHQAATILLLRDRAGTGPSSVEVYMTKRPATMRFLANHHVFPGGQMDELDSDPQLWERCMPLHPAQNPENLTLAYWVTALRELFEEAGILLARGADGEFVQQEAFLHERELLLDHQCTFNEIVKEAGIVLATDQMRYFGHRMTPRAVSRKRFDTRYFLTHFPQGMVPSPHSGEVTEDEWLEPRSGLARWQSGELLMVPPTADSLRALTGFRTADEAMRSEQGVGNPTAAELA
jgi:8-oxo-dGTP pyrophosphatase MutT (NUDIX family)